MAALVQQNPSQSRMPPHGCPATTANGASKPNSIVIAIDPGLSGGVAYKRNLQPAQAVPMPATEGDLVDLLRSLTAHAPESIAYVEEVGGYIGKAQPASSAFKFGRNFGFILGVLQTLGVRVELVRPQRWQKSLACGSASGCASKTEWKNKLKSAAQRLYPQLKPTLATADALLILDFGLRSKSNQTCHTTNPMACASNEIPPSCGHDGSPRSAS